MAPDAALDSSLPPATCCDHDGHLHDHQGVPVQGNRSRWEPLPWGGHPKSWKQGVMSSVDSWLEDRRLLDGAEGLWRVDDNLYDLTDFVARHPGGSEWLELTRGTDITEAFYSHHIGEAAEKLLPKFRVRPAACPRNSPFTFQPDGFYMQLRARARKVLADTPEQDLQEARQRSKNIMDGLALSALLACGAAAYLGSFAVGTAAGVLLSLTTAAAHNFFHQKHNWRRYYFDMCFMSSRDWMVSHALSHHIFPNTIQDLEVTFLEPVLYFLPYRRKSLVVRYASWLYSLLLYASVNHGQFAKRIHSISLYYIELAVSGVTDKEVLRTGIAGIAAAIPLIRVLWLLTLRWSDAAALAVPASMLLAGASLWNTWLMWTWVLVVSSFYFAFQGLTAGHHHPDNYHEGDAASQDKDYGLMQLATTASCSGLRGRESLFLCLTHFGDHRLHHFFPALDHAILPILEPVIAEHLAQYRIPNSRMSPWEALAGKYLQMARNQPNPRPPGSQYQ